MSETSSRKQPQWQVPLEDTTSPKLKLYNSLTRTKSPLIAATGKQLTWYNCGPTVYDESHVGHARLYVTIDIMRRVLTDYFKYDVLFMMNITDIDDKIIVRARHEHLFKEYKNEKCNSALKEVIPDIEESWNTFVSKKFNEETAQNWKSFSAKVTAGESVPGDADPKFKMNFEAAVLKHSY